MEGMDPSLTVSAGTPHAFFLPFLQVSKQYQDFSSIYVSVSKSEVSLQGVVEGCLGCSPSFQPSVPKAVSVMNGSEIPVQTGFSSVHLQSAEQNHRPESQPKYWYSWKKSSQQGMEFITSSHCIMIMAPRTTKEPPPAFQDLKE